MRVAPFLTQLFELGHVHLDTEPPTEDDDDRRDADRILVERARVSAAEFPEPVPDFDPAAAAWAAGQFCWACHFVLFRDAPVDEVCARLSRPIPAGEPAAQHYSVDLVWRFLPDLDRLTTTLAAEDPLREVLRQWGAERPLSSLGMKRIELGRVPELLSHDGLRRAYVDRIIACRDTSRLGDPQVRDLVHAALGREGAKSAAWCQVPPADAAAGDQAGATL